MRKKNACTLCLCSIFWGGDVYLLYTYNTNFTIFLFIVFFQLLTIRCILLLCFCEDSTNNTVSTQQSIYNPIVCIDVQPDSSGEIELTEQCSICLEEDTNDLVELTCKHIFHRACIQEWHKIQNSCPNCRNDMTELV